MFGPAENVLTGTGPEERKRYPLSGDASARMEEPCAYRIEG